MNNQPVFYGALVLYFPLNTSLNEVSSVLGGAVQGQVRGEQLEVVLVEIKNFLTWEVDSLLTELFAKCSIDTICSLLDQLNGSAVIDISFHHYEKFPALIFDGENMEIIRRLCANISIDAY